MNATLTIYNPPVDGVWTKVHEDTVEVEPGHEMDPGASVLVPEPWASLIDWSTEEWNDRNVSYELLVPLGATAENVEEQALAPEASVVESTDDAGNFNGYIVSLNGYTATAANSLAEAWQRAAEEVELAEYYDSCAESEAAAEAAAERYYEERGYWAAAEAEDRERQYTGFYEQVL